MYVYIVVLEHANLITTFHTFYECCYHIVYNWPHCVCVCVYKQGIQYRLPCEAIRDLCQALHESDQSRAQTLPSYKERGLVTIE